MTSWLYIITHRESWKLLSNMINENTYLRFNTIDTLIYFSIKTRIYGVFMDCVYIQACIVDLLGEYDCNRLGEFFFCSGRFHCLKKKGFQGYNVLLSGNAYVCFYHGISFVWPAGTNNTQVSVRKRFISMRKLFLI